jgi:hypothetical protein
VGEHGVAAVDDERRAELAYERGGGDAAQLQLAGLDGCRVRKEI